MTKTDYLNAASDLRRIAYWTATGTNKELSLNLLKNIQQIPEFEKNLKLDFNLANNLLAEEILMASHWIQML